VNGSFQDYKGNIPELIGARFSYVRSLHNKNTQNVLLVWICDESSKIWYRIFMDAGLCFVHPFDKNGFDSDYDEQRDHDLFYKDHAIWFTNKFVKSVSIKDFNGVGEQYVMALSFEFENSEFLMTYNFDKELENEVTTIRFIS